MWLWRYARQSFYDKGWLSMEDLRPSLPPRKFIARICKLECICIRLTATHWHCPGRTCSIAETLSYINKVQTIWCFGDPSMCTALKARHDKTNKTLMKVYIRREGEGSHTIFCNAQGLARAILATAWNIVKKISKMMVSVDSCAEIDLCVSHHIQMSLQSVRFKADRTVIKYEMKSLCVALF